ncbi:hypothetical protein [Streptomyces sp. NPDC014656]|uniref:hypothetical protein n=1 Tax=Streptomyces sp. NPDC014656 TaxID=3364878 RepID=UPI0036FCA286
MTRPWSSRLRLGAVAVAVASTAVAGGLALPGAAVAAPGAEVAAEAADGVVVPFRADARLVSSGPTGFLSTVGDTHYWTRYADGVETPLPRKGAGAYRASAQSDVLVWNEGMRYFVHDLARGVDAEPVVIDSAYELRGVNGSTLVMRDGADGVHLVSRAPGGDVVDRAVGGLPAGAVRHVYSTAPGAFAVQTAGTEFLKDRLSVVDVATGAVTATYDVHSHTDTAQVSAEYVAWRPGPDSTMVADRSGGAPVRWSSWGLLLPGGWMTVGDGFGLSPLGGGETVYALDSARQVVVGGDGTALVHGGTLADGVGLFRVSVGADGKPDVRKVADTGERLDLTVKSETVPTVVDFDREPRQEMSWGFNHRDVSLTVELTHTATGRKTTLRSWWAPDEFEAHVAWDGLSEKYFGAPNGAHTWKMTTESVFGTSVTRSGALTVVRGTRQRDFTDNGVADVLVRDAAGKLSSYEVSQLQALGRDYDCWEEGCRPVLGATTPTTLGTGWNTYTLMASPGNAAGGAADDIVGRDRDGVLWLHRSEQGKLVPRTKVGGGWQVYNKIVGGSDLDGDGRGDLLATDTSGVLWLYTSTGSATRPFDARKRIGGGWQQYNLLVAPGNVAGATGGDLLARDRDGVLWMYLGKGDGTFTARRKVGGGWQKYTHVAPAGLNSRGVADLFATGPAGSAIHYGLGNTSTPFAAASKVPVNGDSTTYKSVF